MLDPHASLLRLFLLLDRLPPSPEREALAWAIVEELVGGHAPDEELSTSAV